MREAWSPFDIDCVFSQETRMEKFDLSASRNWQGIVLHHSEVMNRTPEQWESIRKYHKSWKYNYNSISKEEADELIAKGKKVERPWSDIGYHIGLASSEDWKTFTWLKGRSLISDGAACIGFNQTYLQLCVLGDYDILTPPDTLYAELARALFNLCTQLKIETNRIIGHRESYALLNTKKLKTCPGNNFDLNRVRRLLNEYGIK